MYIAQSAAHKSLTHTLCVQCTAVSVLSLWLSLNTSRTVLRLKSHIYSFFLITCKNSLDITWEHLAHKIPPVYRRHSDHYTYVVNSKVVSLPKTNYLTWPHVTSSTRGQSYRPPKNRHNFDGFFGLRTPYWPPIMAKSFSTLGNWPLYRPPTVRVGVVSRSAQT